MDVRYRQRAVLSCAPRGPDPTGNRVEPLLRVRGRSQPGLFLRPPVRGRDEHPSVVVPRRPLPVLLFRPGTPHREPDRGNRGRAMTRTEQPRISVRRSGQDVALRQLYVALRAAYEALRHAQHVLAPFTITYHPGQRDSLPTRSATRLDALSRFTSGSSDVVEIPVHGATS